MANGASRIFDVMKNTADEKASSNGSELASIYVKTLNPLTFIVDDKIILTEDFYKLDKSLDPTTLQVGDVLDAIVLNNGQMYYVLNNSAGGSGGTTDYTALINKPKINNVELNGNKTAEDLGIENKIEGIEVNGILQTIINKIVNIIVPTKTSDLTNDSNFQENVIEAVNLNNVAQTIANKTVDINIDKTTVGLDNVDNTADADKSVASAVNATNATNATNAQYWLPPADAGFTSDQYGNLQHKRNSTTDNWQFKDNAGNVTGQFFWETGTFKATSFDGKATSAGTADSATTANGLSSTIANNRLPARLQEYRTDATAIDNTVNGFYYASSGGPFERYHSSNKDYMILAQGYSSAWGFQIATDFRTNNLAVRNKNNGTWGSWKIISGTASSRNVTTASSKTHTNFGTNGGNVPTMDFLSCWNGAYSSGNSSNLTYGHQGVILCKPTTLYSNSTGTTGTVTLSQSAGNFNYIRIFYYKAGVYSAVEVGNGKNADLVLFYTATSTIGQLIHKTAKINGTSITVVNTASANPRLDTPAFSGNSNNDNTIYIYYVQGWKDT